MAELVHPEACQLATLIVEEQLGPICKEICALLLRKGYQTLFELAKTSGCPRAELYDALLVLTQHNCIQPFVLEQEEGAKTSPQTVFQPDLLAILHRLRSARCLLHIADTWKGTNGQDETKIAEAIVEGLLENGRLTSQQIYRNVAGKLGCAVDDSTKATKKLLCQLISSHYVERAPPANLTLPKPAIHPDAMAKGRGISAVAKAQEEQAANLRRLDKVSYGRDRFRIPSDLRLDDGHSAAESALKRQKLSHSASTEALDMGTDPILWRVCYEEFNRSFRHAACIAMISQARDEEAAAIASAILTKTRHFETRLKEQESQPLSAAMIKASLEEMMQSGEEVSPIHDVDAVLREIERDDLEMMTSSTGGPDGTMYQVQLDTCINLARLKTIESIVGARFGLLGLRIWRALFLSGQLEQKTIQDMAIGDQKDTRQLLYGMLKGGFMAVTEIPKSADRAASRTFYTWRVRRDIVSERIGLDMVHSMFNIASRLHTESLLNLELVQQLESGNTTILKTHRQQVSHLTGARDLLESSLFRMDELNSVFNDF
ncbi:hypothetical protein WJX84_012227 [Apatococcus fuscideae]|uniref:DNA-directed RNA polymerase III subunit RPC3 n=1 Tax=Apatococcus fuscideae TaxID=2026836 RepID=A0AAW1TB99_9CHLO